MSSLRQDVRSGLRSLARAPGPVVFSLLILALGLGLTAAMFSVVDALLLESLPFPRSDRLVAIEGIRRQGGEVESWEISYPDAADWRAESRSFEALAAHSGLRSFNLRAGEAVEHVGGELVSADYFRALGVAPSLGRAFTAEEDRSPGAARVVVVAEDLWARRFGGERRLDGEELLLNGEPYRITGVMPRGFHGVSGKAELWLPLALSSELLSRQYVELRRFRWLSAVGRLAPGVTPAAAQADLDAVTAALEEEYPDSDRSIGGRVRPLREALLGNLGAAVLILFAAAGAVLLVACINVAGLLLARGSARQRELALRTVLGASRGLLVRQLLVEAAMLALAAWVLGLLVARWAVGLLVVASPVAVSGFATVAVDGRTAALSALVALACGLGFGAVPAWMATRGNLAASLREGGRSSGGRGRHRLRSALVVAQLALALVLVSGAGLMMRSFQALRSAELGFRPDHLLTLRLDLKGERYGRDAAVHELARELLERVRSLPGVRQAALTGPGLPTDAEYGSRATVRDAARPGEVRTVELWIHHVTPEYFSTVGIPLLAGRVFGLGDGPKPPAVIILSRSAAARLWPGETEIVGRQVKPGGPESAFPWFTVVGVVGDALQRGVEAGRVDNPDAYFALFQFPPKFPPIVNVLARYDGTSSELLATALRREVRAVAPDLAPYDGMTAAERLRQQQARPRFLAALLASFAWLALLLAALGLYGVLSHAVAQRRREVGIRMALGSGRAGAVLLMLERGAVLGGLGIGLGLAGSLALSRLLQGLLYGVSPRDPATLAATSSLLFAVALVASYLPARKAARVDPAVVLREE